ncbi:transcriptional regulator [Sanguibacter keddieii DSM 10542]|uniref:Transcriptional regulator n=1 Tax=Sanguibacter keddieii (strain ATCC 51767 / DSM 10542 / NCFB 3025 / ST-74) TaxID=446469 RepID=D1BI45_SANKS|nr:MarR family transcriptional regulator [Sanguibacter keddieii]ACZ20019.1 transcriptional regulator [Sanguibacter keddieii DSM 10542]
MDDVTWLDSDEHTAWVRLMAVLTLLPGALDTQLGRDSDLNHFEYFTLAMLSEAPGRRLRMSALAARTNATLPRLSRVVSRLETAGLVERSPCPEDGRATNATLTEAGWEKVVQAAPGHVRTARELVVDALEPEQVGQLAEIARRILTTLDPEQKMFATSD